MKTDKEEKEKKIEEACEKQPEKQPEPTAEENLRAELAALDDKYKRALAEYDNFRKRSQREREAAFGDGAAAVVSAILPLIDNLNRGAAQENADDGVVMMNKQACELLEKLNVKSCGKAGETFNPSFHNAVQHIEDETLGENVITEVLACGYTMGDRLIRPAMVKTAN